MRKNTRVSCRCVEKCEINIYFSFAIGIQVGNIEGKKIVLCVNLQAGSYVDDKKHVLEVIHFIPRVEIVCAVNKQSTAIVCGKDSPSNWTIVYIVWIFQ